MKASYTTAVLELLAAGKEVPAVLSGLKRAMQAHGHEKLYAPVLRNVVRIVAAEPVAGATVTIARAEDRERYQKEIEAALAALPVTTQPTASHTVIDDTLIGGFTVTNGTHLLDASFKSKLLNLYRRITT